MIKRLLKAFNTPIHYKDEYIEILRKVNAGMLHHGNIECFNFAIKNLPSDNPIIEIGTFCGLSANVITYLKKKHARRNVLITADKTYNLSRTGIISVSDVTFEEYREYVQNTLKKNLLTFSREDLPFVIDITSDDFFLEWGQHKSKVDIFNRKIDLGGKISFAYIDGNHSYDYVKRDFENCNYYLDKGGFLLFDDSHDFSYREVRIVIKEIKKSKNYKLIMKNPNYLFQKIE